MRAAFFAHGEFDRREFGMRSESKLETGGFIVGDRVEVHVEAEAVEATRSPTGLTLGSHDTSQSDSNLGNRRRRRIASDASFSRPLTGDATELNAALPAKFFEEQDQLRARARALAEPSHVLNPYRVAEAYGHLSEACVRCHAVYRQGS
jgi:hypothetical protein